MEHRQSAELDVKTGPADLDERGSCCTKKEIVEDPGI
jgi:hypothetical protein